ncbi:MAG: TauD/TfdA family dioxygenase [Pseudomonadota bacterium]
MSPAALQGPCVWHGAELAQDDSWVWRWSQAEIAEIETALAAVRKAGLAWHQMERESFPIKRVAARLAQVGSELEDGKGLIRLVGLPIDKYTADELKIIWYGLTSHLGSPVYQDCQGQLMREIRDEGGDLGARHGRLSSGGKDFLSSKARTYSAGALRFHTDRCDVVGLLAVGQAPSGGVSKVASSAAVHNAMLEQRPDLLELLYRPIPRSRLGEEQGGDEVVYELPVFGQRDGKLTSHYSRTYIEAAQLLADSPALTAVQWQALDLLAATAEELCFEMHLAPGDIQLLNNHAVYHARSAFEDDPARGRRRLLYRVWLAMPNSRALPEDHAVLWGDTRAGARRGGIGQEPLM